MNQFFKKLLLTVLLFAAAIYIANYVFVKRYRSVTLDEKIGQMLIVGFEGTKVDKNLRHIILGNKVGGVILVNSSPNPERKVNIVSKMQVMQLTHDIKGLNPNIFIAVDEEGGNFATRLNPKNGFEKTKSHKELGDSNLIVTYNESSKISKMLKGAGFNLNFAPVLDIYYSQNPIIGKLNRSFSNNLDQIYQYSKSYIDGQHKNNIITSIKHFPGQGNSKSDTHVTRDDTTKTWNANLLLPYGKLINVDNYNDMVMVSHIFNSKLDKKYPASLSKAVITGILRNNLAYNGVIITDSLDMGAIIKYYSLKETVINAILAGNDILLYVNNNKDGFNKDITEDIINIIKEAVKNGTISEERINKSYERIINLKKRYHLM